MKTCLQLEKQIEGSGCNLNNNCKYPKCMINNDIQESYVNYQIAKLLKEKGFKVECLHFYCKNNTCNHIEKPYEYSFKVNANCESKDNFGYGETTSAPTHALAIKWIRENFKIHVYTDCSTETYWYYKLISCENGNFKSIDDGKNNFESSYEATEAALLYILNNLI